MGRSWHLVARADWFDDGTQEKDLQISDLREVVISET